MGVGPLSDLTVLEVGGDVAVRYCGRLFARLGATVTRIGDDDDTRLGQGGAAGAAFGQWLDQGKTRAAAAGGGCDLVVGGQTPGEAVAARALAARVGAVALSLTWFGETGPYADWRGHDAILHALTGVAYSFGETQGPPILAQGHAPQIVGGLTAFIAAMAGLMGERPARIDVNVFEAAMCFMETGAVSSLYTGLGAHRLGVNRFVPSYPCQIYAASDGYIGVTALTPAQWRAFAALIGLPELSDDEHYAMSVQRLMLADELDAIIAPFLETRSVMEWVAEGDRRRIPITPVRPPGALPFDEHWAGRGAFAPISAAAGAPLGPDLPFRMAWDGQASPRPAGGALGPLTGVKVADFSMGWAGPLAGRYLADLGADVRKIESNGHPDWWRGWEVVPDVDPPPTEVVRNFMCVNRNKRGLDLDLSTPQGLAHARVIIADSDLVLENLGPGIMQGLGLGPADQRRLRPGIVSISMPPFGRDGPLSGLRAYGSTVEHACGMPFVNGHDDWPPCLQHVAYGDPVAGLYAAAAALVGLYGRAGLGGADIELCQVEGLFQLGADAIIGEQARGAASPRSGSVRATARLCTVVSTGGEDAWLAVAADDEAAMAALQRVVGASGPGAVEAALAGWAAGRDAGEAAAMLQAAGVAAGPVTPASALCADPHLAVADYWVLQQRRHVGEHLTPAAPLRFDGARPAVRTAAPLLGEHTDEVLGEVGVVRA
jgi:crotonobetainyl-CoA:carnitine CoA-transferase CaiB-like acyl-CoA transferase